MSKVKDEMERIQEREFDQYVSFMEYVYNQQKEVSENDVTNEEEESTDVPSTPRTSIVPINTLKAANNTDFNPNRSIK